jgi:hypothetical protein
MPLRSTWRSSRKNFLLPVQVMGDLFRGKMLSKIRRAQQSGRLDLGAVSSQELRYMLETFPAVQSGRKSGGGSLIMREPSPRSPGSLRTGTAFGFLLAQCTWSTLLQG